MLDRILDLNIFDFFSIVQTIRNGYKDTENQYHYEEDYDFYDYEYQVSSPNEVIDNNCGWCFDISNLIHAYCDYNDLEHTSLYIEYDEDSNYISQIKDFIQYKDQWYFAPDNSIKETFGFIAYPTKEACVQSFIDDFKSYLEYYLKDKYNADRLNINQFNYMFTKGNTFETCLDLIHKKFN